MNTFKNMFALHLSRNVPSTQLVLRTTYKDEGFFRAKYLMSILLKKVKCAPFAKKSNCQIKGHQNTFSTKTKTVFGNPGKRPLLEGKDFLDDHVHLNNVSGTTLQVAGFKSITDSRLKKPEKGTEPRNSLKANESKSSSQDHIDQEAHSYAKLISNYSRAMETDSVHTRSFDKSFGSSNMLFNSSFERVISSFSKIKDRKEAKIGSNLGRSSSTPSPKHPRDLQTDGDKNGKSSFYSTDSGKQDWTKKVDIVFDELKDSIIDKTKDVKNTVKLEEKDVLETVEQRADWLDKVVKAYKKIRTSPTIPNSEIVKPDEVKRTMDLGKEKPQSKHVSKKISMSLEDSTTDSFLQNTPSPIELSFAPVIDTITYPTKMAASFEKKNHIEAEMKSSSKMEKPIEESVNLPNQENSFDILPHLVYLINGNQGSEKINMNKSKNPESSSLLNNTELRVNGRPSSESKSVIIKNGEINIVNSGDKIEIHIPISSLLDENKKHNVEKILKSSLTLKLLISAKIEDKRVVTKGETKSEFKKDQVKVEPKKEVKIVLSSPDEKRSMKSYNLEKTGNETLNKDFPWRTQTGSSEVNEENILKKTNITKTEKILPLSSKKLTQAAVSAESNDRTLPTSVVTPKSASENLETPNKSEKIVKDSPLKNQEEVKIEKNKEVDDNLVNKDMGIDFNLNINKLKARRRRKGTTVISRVIENELLKKNEQIILKEKKVTRPTTETEKNLPLAEALKPETQVNQNTSTIDKVTKIDKVTDQRVKKLSESITVAKDESKKFLDTSTSEMLKIKQKGLNAKESPKKEIATSVTEGKLPEIKSKREASDSEKPHTVHNPQTKPLTSLPNVAKTAKKDESQAQKSELTVYKAKTVPASNNEINLNKDVGTTFEEKSGKTEIIRSKDIPNELKPIEKKKDGTLIDYGLKVSSRKSLGKDYRKSNSKEQPIIKGMTKEIIPKKEEKLVSGNEKNGASRTSANALQLNSVKEQKQNNSLKGIPVKAAEITSPSSREESLQLKSAKIIQREKSASLSMPKGENPLSRIGKPSGIPLVNAEKSLLVQSISISLKLLEYEENHIFSGPDRHLLAKDS